MWGIISNGVNEIAIKLHKNAKVINAFIHLFFKDVSKFRIECELKFRSNKLSSPPSLLKQFLSPSNPPNSINNLVYFFNQIPKVVVSKLLRK